MATSDIPTFPQPRGSGGSSDSVPPWNATCAGTPSARWYGEWTGADKPYRAGLDDGPSTPGMHAGSADEAYADYLDFLDVREPAGH